MNPWTRRLVAWLLLGSAFAALPACASLTSLRARGYAGFMQSQVVGDAGLGVANGSVTATIDVEDTLGLGDLESSPYGRAELGLGPLGLTVSAFQNDSSGSGTLTVPFGNISASTPVNSSLDLVDVKAAATFTLLDIGPVRIAPGVAVNYLDVDLQVAAPSLSITETVDGQVPVPMVFAQGEVDLGMVALTADVGGIVLDVGDLDGTAWDVEALLRVQPLSHVEVFGGFRWISYELAGTSGGQPFTADLELRGWFVGGGVTF